MNLYNIHSHERIKQMINKPPKVRRVHVFVTENGKKTADVRLPYGMFRLGMKYGKDAAKGETDSCAKAISRLQDFDCAAFERAVAAGKITLPHLLIDTIDEQSATHVIITAEG
jgi:hypothetical protein